MDERHEGAPHPHQQFIDTMRAVEDAQPSFGKALGRAFAQVITEEQNGADVALIPDPNDMIGDDEASMGHDLAALQGLDLSPFGLAVSVTHETGGDGSTKSSSRVVLDDGDTFVDFLNTISPADVDNHNLMDDADPAWWMRRGLTTAVHDVFGGAATEVRAQEAGQEGELSHSARELLRRGPDIGQALRDNGWAHGDGEQRVAREISELPTYVEGGVATGYLDLSASGILGDDVAHGPAGWLHDGPVDERLIDGWRHYGQSARTAAERNPELAGEWPAQVERHYEAAVEHLQDSGRIAELMQIEGAIGHEMRASNN